MQLIDATLMKKPIRKNMGKKNCELTSEIRKEIMRIFMDMEESEVSRVFNNEELGYWNVTVERPLRLRVYPDRRIPRDVFKKAEELQLVIDGIKKASEVAQSDDWDAFAKATRLKKAQLNKIRPYITEKDRSAKPVKGVADTELRESEQIPLDYPGGIDRYIEKEILPYAPDAWVDMKSQKIGYGFSFNKFFYHTPERRNLDEILRELKELEELGDAMTEEIIGGLKDDIE